MIVLSILLYIFILGVGFFSITSAYSLTRSFKFSYLNNYFHFLIAFNVVGFVFFILNRFFYSENLLWNSILILFPLIVISAFLFVNFILSTVDRKMSSNKVILYFSISAILFIAYGLIYNSDDNQPLLRYYFYLLVLLLTIVTTMSLLTVLTRGIRVLEKKKQKAIRDIALIYTVLLTLLHISFLFRYDPLLPIVKILFFFIVNLYPLIYLKNFLNMNYIDHLLVNEKKINFDKFFEKFRISDREKEIVKFLVQGKSNKDIEDRLFISLKTVKNHIYNIYKKTGVNSRIQLVNLVMKFKK